MLDEVQLCEKYESQSDWITLAFIFAFDGADGQPFLLIDLSIQPIYTDACEIFFHVSSQLRTRNTRKGMPA